VANRGIDLDVIRGISVGALNAAFLAQTLTARNSLASLQEKVKELYKVWTKEFCGIQCVYNEKATPEGNCKEKSGKRNLLGKKKCEKSCDSLVHIVSLGTEEKAIMLNLAVGRARLKRLFQPVR
jgi:hypothetical protein